MTRLNSDFDSKMRAVALFMDGVSRAAMLPFGPSLVYRLACGETLKLGLDCSKIIYPLMAVVVAYLLGRAFGVHLGANANYKIPMTQKKNIPRVAGAVASLHLFTFGAGIKSIWWLILIRFTSGGFVGLLCTITKPSFDQTHIKTRECKEHWLEAGLIDECQTKRKNSTGNLDFASGTTKLYTTAFATSILSGGLLYRHAAGNATFQALTGSKQVLLSLFFMISVAGFAECSIHCLLTFFGPTYTIAEFSPRRQSQEVKESIVEEMGTKLTQNDMLGITTKDLAESKSAGLASNITFSDFDQSSSFPNELERPGSISNGRERSLTVESGEFYDCNSFLSDVDEFSSVGEDEDAGGYSDSLALYVDKQCIYPDGSPAHVPPGDSSNSIPQNYLTLSGGRLDKARELWIATQKWRREREVWRIHTFPHRWFPDIKEAYPHFIHGVSKKGYPIIYEQPGKMNLAQLFREGCEVEDMVKHYIFFLEHISNRICTRDEVRPKNCIRPPPHNSSSWGIMVAMDVKGAGLSHLSGDVLSYLKRAGDINNSHYPLSLKRAFVINSPFWLAGAWKSIRGILPESVHVDILSSHNYLSALREYVDDDQIPAEYGGSSPYKLGEHPYEVELQELVNEANENDISTGKDDMSVISSSKMDFSDQCKVSTSLVDSRDVDCSATPKQFSNNGLDTATNRSGLYSRHRVKSRDFPNTQKCDRNLLKEEKSKGEYDVFVIATIIFFLWGAIQGVIETTIPLWILMPPEMGGLGYAPSRSGVALFCAAMVLLWTMRTKFSKVISSQPTKVPMRSFRIGVGAESVLLLLVATVPKTVSPSDRTDAVLVMAVTIILISCVALSSVIGRAASTILHRAAAASFAKSGISPARNCLIGGYRVDNFVVQCCNGHFTRKVSTSSEIIGVLAVAPLLKWSLSDLRPCPFDGTCGLLLSSLVALVLYIWSFSLHLDPFGDYSSHPRGDGCSDVRAKKCGSFLCEVATVSVSDMASLFEESNWSMSPLLRPERQYHTEQKK